MTIQVGQWVRRDRNGKASLTHICESLVADDVITRCGKRLRDELGGLTVDDDPRADQFCTRCFR